MLFTLKNNPSVSPLRGSPVPLPGEPNKLGTKTHLFFLPPLKGEVPPRAAEGFGQTTGLTQADLSGGLRRPVGRLCRSKAMDCLVEALAGNVRQARLMKNTRRPYPPARLASPPFRGAQKRASSFCLPWKGRWSEGPEGSFLAPNNPSPSGSLSATVHYRSRAVSPSPCGTAPPSGGLKQLGANDQTISCPSLFAAPPPRHGTAR